MKFFLPLFLFSFIICSPAMADQKIVFVDMDRLVSVSKPGSSIFKQLKDINNKNILKEINKNKELKQNVKKIKEIVEYIDNQFDIIADEEAEKEYNDESD